MRRSALRLLALAGAAALALLLWRTGPRDVTLVYDLHGVGEARDLDVRISRGGEVLRRADFPTPGAQVRHAMKLPDGTYHLAYSIERPGGALAGTRDIQVSESETIILSLAP